MSNNSPDNRYFLDGIDLWKTFSIAVQKGSDFFLKLPARKDSVTHDWKDEDGIDIDTSRVYFKEREAQIEMWSVTKTEDEFWTKYNNFLSVWRKPGTRRLEVIELSRQFFIIYKDNNIFERFTRIKNSDLIATKFTITVLELKPSVNTAPTFLIEERGRFLIS
jgi:hypothetical protein